MAHGGAEAGAAEGHLNSPSSLKHLQELTDHVKGNVDVVVSLGIGGSYLGDKVIFDVSASAFDWRAVSSAWLIVTPAMSASFFASGKTFGIG